MPRSLSRRHFLAASTLLPVAAASLSSSFARAAYEPIPRQGGSHLRLSLNAFSFLELLNANLKDPTKGLDLFGVCDFCAKVGFDAVDLTGYFFPGYPKAPADDYLIRLKRHAFNLGLAISGTGVRNDFTAANPATRAEGVQRIKDWIEVAAKLGAPTVRAFADSQYPFKNWQEASGNAARDTVEAYLADALRECADTARNSASSSPCKTMATLSALAPSISACSVGSITSGAPRSSTPANTSRRIPTPILPSWPLTR